MNDNMSGRDVEGYNIGGYMSTSKSEDKVAAPCRDLACADFDLARADFEADRSVACTKA